MDDDGLQNRTYRYQLPLQMVQEDLIRKYSVTLVGGHKIWQNVPFRGFTKLPFYHAISAQFSAAQAESKE